MAFPDDKTGLVFVFLVRSVFAYALDLGVRLPKTTAELA